IEEMDTWQTLRLAYKAGTTSQSVQFLSEGGAAAFYVDSVHVIELTGIGASALLRAQQFAYDAKGRTVLEAAITLDASASADTDMLTLAQETRRQYYDAGNGNGLLEKVSQIDLSGSDTTTTTYFYDS